MKKFTCSLLFFTVLGFLSDSTFAQKKATQQLTPSGNIRCLTVESEEALRAEFPGRASVEEFERWIAPQIAKMKADKAANRNVTAVYNIPVVIHIIHNGDCVGTGENITDAQAISQITVMNQDYRRLAGTPGGANTTGLAADIEINFVLAKVDPSGNPTTGIERRNIAPYTNAVVDGPGGADWELRADVQAMKTATTWDPSRYLNMWTIRPGGNSLTAATPGLAGLLGYAQFPDASGLNGLNATGGAASTDGVVAGYDAFGTIAQNDGTFVLNAIYNAGRTMTHEVGHWLGLRHIWGDNTTCTIATGDTGKDFCPDTPAASAENYSCNLTADSCPADPGNDQVQNYMDYTNDACMDTFTPDQKARMQAVMAISPRRASLNTSIVGTATTAGVYFTKDAGKCLTYNETTTCTFTDVNYSVSILKAPTAAVTATFAAAGSSTATNNADFQIITPTLTFNAGSTANQNFTIRYFNDGIQESTENILINMSVTGGGSAIIDYTTLSVDIIDNDVAPSPTSSTTVLFSANADAASPATTVSNFDGDAYNWGLAATSATSVGWGITGNFYQSRSWINTGTPTPLSPDNLITFSTPITIPSNGVTTLKFKIGSSYVLGGRGEKYSIYLTPSIITAQAGANAATALLTETSTVRITAANSPRSINLSGFAGQTLYLSFRHYDSVDFERLIVDDIEISNVTVSDVQSLVNTSTSSQVPLPQSGTLYAKDATSGKLIADLTSSTAFNYGCVNTFVSRDNVTAGAYAVNYLTNTAANAKVTSKVITITPGTASTADAGSIKFYFTETEIANWETLTGNNRSALKVIKDGTGIIAGTTVAPFGAFTTLTAPITNGLGGVYYFGSNNTLGISSSEFSNAISVYPNPANETLNISVANNSDLPSNYIIYNTIGQLVSSKNIKNQKDLTVDTSSFSKGVYFIKIEKEENFKTIQFIKN